MIRDADLSGEVVESRSAQPILAPRDVEPLGLVEPSVASPFGSPADRPAHRGSFGPTSGFFRNPKNSACVASSTRTIEACILPDHGLSSWSISDPIRRGAIEGRPDRQFPSGLARNLGLPISLRSTLNRACPQFRSGTQFPQSGQSAMARPPPIIGQAFIASRLRRRDGEHIIQQAHAGAGWADFIHFLRREKARERWPVYQAARRPRAEARRRAMEAQLANKRRMVPSKVGEGRDPAPSCVIDRK